MGRSEGAWRLSRAAIPVTAIVVLVCLLAASWITFDRVVSAFAVKDWVSHTNQVRAKLEEIYGRIAAAESDQRAYLLTLDEDSRTRYRAARSDIDALIEEVETLTKDNPRQRQPLMDLSTAVAARFTSMEGSENERRLHGLDRTLQLLSDGRGFQAMGDVRGVIAKLNAEENRLLQERRRRSASEVTQAEVSFGFTLVISVVLISALSVLASRVVALREAAAEEERTLRSDLEREIERTKVAEVKLEATMAELRRSNEELQNFAFVASHDLQEPLRKIRAFSDRVRRRSGSTMDAESLDSLVRVEAAADRMQRLILDLLDLSRITTKGRPHVRVDLNTAIDETADDLQTRLEDTGGTVVHGALPSVVVDPAQLRQLLQNLVANALKFRREGVPPAVRIEGERRPDGRVEVRLSDNGIGFEPKYADRIFIVFQRLHGRGEYEGSGIGLAIVRKIVERHGGTIRAEGKPGEGASFVFDLPGEASPPVSGATLMASESE